MTEDASRLRDTIIPKSDQINADDLLAGPMTVTVKSVRRGTPEQPVEVVLQEQLPYRPCKSMRRVLIAAWGDNGAAWVGRGMTLYCDPSVMFGGVRVGGIRISHLSHIDRPLELALTVTRGKRTPYRVEVLRQAQGKAPALVLEEVLASQGVTMDDADRFAREREKPLPSEGDDGARAKWAKYFAANPGVLQPAEMEAEPEPEEQAGEGDPEGDAGGSPW